ncbi:MAG: hypothetical protein ACK58L_14770 [Planctomycetota bacterium]
MSVSVDRILGQVMPLAAVRQQLLSNARSLLPHMCSWFSSDLMPCQLQCTGELIASPDRLIDAADVVMRRDASRDRVYRDALCHAREPSG